MNTFHYTNNYTNIQTQVNNFFESFGDALSNFLKNKGLKQAFLVSNTGISKDLISNYATNKRVPNDANRAKIEKALGVLFVHSVNGWAIKNDDNSSEPSTLKETAVDYKILTDGIPVEQEFKILKELYEKLETAQKAYKLYVLTADMEEDVAREVISMHWLKIAELYNRYMAMRKKGGK